MKFDINSKNTGVVSTIVGIGIFLLSIVFSQGYSPESGFIRSLSNMEIVLIEGVYVEMAIEKNVNTNPLLPVTPIVIVPEHYEGRVTIPLKYPISFSIIVILLGIGIVIISRNNDRNL